MVEETLTLEFKLRAGNEVLLESKAKDLEKALGTLGISLKFHHDKDIEKIVKESIEKELIE